MAQYYSGPISQLPPAPNPVLGSNIYPATDITDLTESPSGTTYKYTVAELAAYIETFVGGFSWVTIPGFTQDAVSNTGYIPIAVANTTIVLPSTMPVGAIIRVAGSGSCAWTVQANVGQTIQIGNVSSSTTGSASSSDNNDAIELVCTVADTKWTMISGVSRDYTII